ncbi:hypothetical protein LEMLEM_LOCUS597, partial [Lemmus lemmus]
GISQTAQNKFRLILRGGREKKGVQSLLTPISPLCWCEEGCRMPSPTCYHPHFPDVKIKLTYHEVIWTKY